ncbi:MAG TPA: DUF4129 domain-containing protein [Ktedonobacteraceae bacterium]|nr:DUF4129 domain-containing protein [Ktedonobacteraceae bacterium]
MNPLQMEPPRSPQKRQRGILSPAQWHRQNILMPPDTDITSLGEFLLPSLLGAMESCWIAAALIGLAGAGFLGTNSPLLPFWTPFVFIIGTQWLFYFIDRRDENARHAPQFIALAVLLCLFIIWLQVYAPVSGIFDPRWLGAMFSDVLFLNTHFFQVVFIVALSFLLCWRGLLLLSRTIEPSMIFRTLCMGLIIMIVVIVLLAQFSAGNTALHAGALLFLLIPLFLYLSLAAHSLARIAFVRRSHTTGLQGSVVTQERAVLTVMGLLGAALLVITLVIALFAGPAFFTSALHTLAPLGSAIANAYSWLIGILADIAIFLLTPVVWLINWLTHLVPTKAPPKPNPPIKFGQHPLKALPVSHATNPALLLTLKILVPVVVLLVIALLVRRALRKRKKTNTRRRLRDGDFHESLWSWTLFWSQLRAILRSIFGRFLPQPAAESTTTTTPVLEPADAAARDIRAIYRAFLKKATARGYARKKDETPGELRQRLDEKTPLVEPQLEAITDAYIMVRYGESLPNAGDVAYVQGKWSELDQKWV